MRLLPRDEKFFDLFTSVAALSVEAAKLQLDLLRAEPPRRGPIVDAIKRLEHEADQITHEVVTRLDRVFITPLDREDIHLLASRLDDVVDLIDGAAHRVQMYHAGDAPRGRSAAGRRGRPGHPGAAGCGAEPGEEQGPVGAGSLRAGQTAGGGGRLAVPRVGGALVRRIARPADGDQVEGDLRHPGKDAGPHGGRGERPGVDLHQARLSMDNVVLYVVVIVAVALVFDFINGFHDSANSIATVVSTRVLSPGKAVFWAAFFNFVAAFVVGTAVAKTIGKGLIDISVVDPNVILGGLLGAIVWDLVTWYLGLPSSSSHALLGGYAGAAIAKAGFGALILEWLGAAGGLYRDFTRAGNDDRAGAHRGALLAAAAAHRPGRWIGSSAAFSWSPPRCTR